MLEQWIMLDYLRNLTKSDEEKRQELLTADLVKALTPKQQQQVESELARDEALTAELDQMRILQQQMRQLPQRRVRRNFTLDPALYGRPQREPLVQVYPVLRTATVLAAFLFIFAVAANIFLGGMGGDMSEAAPVAMQVELEEEAAAEPLLEEAEADAVAMDAEVVEEAAEEAIIAEEVIVSPEAALPAPEMDAAAAVPRQSATPAQIEEAESALVPAPSMTAEGTAGAEQAMEMRAAEATPSFEIAEMPETGSTAVTDQDDDLDRGNGGNLTQESEVGILAGNLSLIALLLGLVFVLLFILTLIARRRL